MTGVDVLLATSEVILEVAWAALVLAILVTGAKLLWACGVTVTRIVRTW
jgi:hypothetical protein